MLAIVFSTAALEPFADLRHGDHGPHADDHAQGREGRSHLVPPQIAQGRAQCKAEPGSRR